jgi:hypothetical protein
MALPSLGKMSKKILVCKSGYFFVRSEIIRKSYTAYIRTHMAQIKKLKKIQNPTLTIQSIYKQCSGAGSASFR